MWWRMRRGRGASKRWRSARGVGAHVRGQLIAPAIGQPVDQGRVAEVVFAPPIMAVRLKRIEAVGHKEHQTTAGAQHTGDLGQAAASSCTCSSTSCESTVSKLAAGKGRASHAATSQRPLIAGVACHHAGVIDIQRGYPRPGRGQMTAVHAHARAIHQHIRPCHPRPLPDHIKTPLLARPPHIGRDGRAPRPFHYCAARVPSSDFRPLTSDLRSLLL